MSDGGKGDKPRPLGVPIEQFDKNFEAIFGKKDKLTPNQERGVEIRRMIDELPVSKTLNANLEPIPFVGMVEIEDDDIPSGS